jgi:hypothetical protein
VAGMMHATRKNRLQAFMSSNQVHNRLLDAIIDIIPFELYGSTLARLVHFSYNKDYCLFRVSVAAGNSLKKQVPVKAKKSVVKAKGFKSLPEIEEEAKENILNFLFDMQSMGIDFAAEKEIYKRSGYEQQPTNIRSTGYRKVMEALTKESSYVKISGSTTKTSRICLTDAGLKFMQAKNANGLPNAPKTNKTLGEFFRKNSSPDVHESL